VPYLEPCEFAVKGTGGTSETMAQTLHLTAALDRDS